MIAFYDLRSLQTIVLPVLNLSNFFRHFKTFYHQRNNFSSVFYVEAAFRKAYCVAFVCELVAIRFNQRKSLKFQIDFYTYKEEAAENKVSSVKSDEVEESFPQALLDFPQTKFSLNPPLPTLFFSSVEFPKENSLRERRAD